MPRIPMDIHDLLPQQEPFVMVDRLVGYTPDSCTTETLIRQDNLFVDGSILSPCGILENVAQTWAAHIGYYFKYILHKDLHKDTRIGLLGAVRDFNFFGSARAGSTLRTSVRLIEEVLDVTLASATVECDGEVIASGQIKLAMTEAVYEIA